MSAPFSIVAEFPLGTFRGAAEDGRLDPMPSVSRLYSALLSAAGFGPRALVANEVPRPCAADETALSWVEVHLPDSVSIPRLRSNLGMATAYRDTGTLLNSKVRKSSKYPDASVAVGGNFVWTWTTPPPDEVVEALDALCGDVPYLGTTESPVRLRTTRQPSESTHALDAEAGLFAGVGADVEVPVQGRLSELKRFHDANVGKSPRARADEVHSSESEVKSSPPRSRVALARYATLDHVVSDVPWPQVLVLPIDRLPPEQLRVRCAVALHRLLISSIGDGAPPLITGAYAPGAPRPANRIALHVVDGRLLPELGSKAALLIMIPSGASAADVATVSAAAATLRSFRGAKGDRPSRVGPVALVAGDQFWSSPPAGTVRLWALSPPAVPDVRGWGEEWGFAEAMALSFAYVWQATELIGTVSGAGEERARALVEQATSRLGPVVQVEPVRTSRPHDYVHRVNEHAVVRPYRALLSTGGLGTDRTVQAIGQSRHLGGGLLVPVDIPADGGADARS